MEEIEVAELASGIYLVRVTSGNTATDHRVSVPISVLEKLGVADADPEVVVRESFAFLLEREPATSILREFRLDTIARYFPEYTDELPRRLRG